MVVGKFSVNRIKDWVDRVGFYPENSFSIFSNARNGYFFLNNILVIKKLLYAKINPITVFNRT